MSSSVQIVCVGKGYAANSEVKITKGGQAIATNSDNISTTRTNVTLDSVQCSDGGEYQCTVANSGTFVRLYDIASEALNNFKKIHYMY